MRRTNTFKVIFKHPAKAESLGKGCAVLWNALNYRRRQAFFAGEFDWDSKVEYDEFKGWIGAVTAQQIIRKNDQAWRAFFSMCRKKKDDRLPAHIRKVKPPGYWKDRQKGILIPRIIIRNDSYRISGRNITLPFGLKCRIKGKPRWNGKQGALELHYDESKKCWRAYQSVTTEPIYQPSGQKRAFVDIGVKCILAAVIDGDETPMIYKGAPLLADWWHWTHEIAKAQSTLAKANGKKSSRRIGKLHRTRKLRFRQAVNEIVWDFVERCHHAGVSRIIAGDLTGILNNGEKRSKKSNAMVHNFWHHKYVADRLRFTAENFGMGFRREDEYGTSSRCPRCGSTDIVRRGRLFKCKSCGLEAHRDAVGAVNIGVAHPSGAGHTNWAMARPEVVKAFCPSHTGDLEGIPSL